MDFSHVKVLISFFFLFPVGASFKPIQDEATSSSYSTSNSQVTEVVSTNPDPDPTKQENPPETNPQSTGENTPVKTSAASKAAAFFTSGKMSSSSTDLLKKSKSSPEGSDCELI